MTLLMTNAAHCAFSLSETKNIPLFPLVPVDKPIVTPFISLLNVRDFSDDIAISIASSSKMPFVLISLNELINSCFEICGTRFQSNCSLVKYGK